MRGWAGASGRTSRSVGDRVKANCEEWSRYYDGVITQVDWGLGFPTYTIKFDNDIPFSHRRATEAQIEGEPPPKAAAKATAGRSKADRVPAKCPRRSKCEDGESTPAASTSAGDGFATLHVYVCAALLTRWSDKLCNMDFQQLVTFLQHLPTAEWTEKDVAELLSQAFVFKSLYHNAQSHLRS